MESYVKDYPRPQMVRRNWTNLNGEWDFAFDDAAAGEKRGFCRDFPSERKIQVPFTYETKSSGIGLEEPHNCVWYERSFELEQDVPKEKELLLWFEGSDYQTRVWVNGSMAGEHKGGYARFGFNITDYVKAGQNKVTVCVKDNLSEQLPRGKQRWVKNNFACWYVQTTGIWKAVWMEEVPKCRISRLKLTPDFSRSSLIVEAELAGEFSGVCGLSGCRLEAEASFGGVLAGAASTAVTRNVVRTEVNLYNTNVTEFGIKAWSPEEPNLYDLKITLWNGAERSDQVLSYAGMRDIKVQGRSILLNGGQLYQRLILDQGYWSDSHLTPPSEEALTEDIDKILRLGFNGVRKHQKTEDERFLYWCDVKGLLVWSEMAAGYLFEDGAVESFTREWMEIVRQNYSHPCIITWTPFNESWGVPGIRDQSSQQKFTEAIYGLTKSFDAMRPVITNDGWDHTVSDLVTLHDYASEGAELKLWYQERLEALLENKITRSDGHRAFAEGYPYRGQPVLITEYGGIAFKNEIGWGYGEQVRDEAAFLKRYEDVTTAIQNIPEICGFCYTQVSDVQQEVNGLMDADRNFKVNPDVIREINLRRK